MPDVDHIPPAPPEDHAGDDTAGEERPGEAGKKATRYDAWAYLLIGLLAIPLTALGIGALILPPGIAFSLVRRGISEGRVSWTVLGVLTGFLWLLLLVASARKVMRGGRMRRPPAEP